jgi:hypothetical protein
MKRRRGKPSNDPAGGEDSFLDVVTNLVGILVILVMVIGIRSKDAYVESQQPEPAPQDARQVAARDQTRVAHHNLEANVHEVQQQIDQLEMLVEARQNERHQLQVLMAAARRELDERRQSLDERQQRQVAAAAEAGELEYELARLDAQRRSLEKQGDRPIELEHLPTPLARTVFGHEEHFRLKAGRLVYVPLNELTEMLKSEIPHKVWRLKETPRITETLGPVQGFHLRYTMQRTTVEQPTPAGAVVRQMAELEQFVLIPISDEMGETVDQALRGGSQFTQLLETLRPGATVITVWTYPDSFHEFRQIKKWLFDRGFSTAARPLPDGQPISGSPQGSRSAAQ